MQRTRLIDFRTSRGPASVGICQSDLPGCAAIVNSAQQRLITAREAGDTGWYGSWVKMVFNVSRNEPVIVLSRDVVRLINADVCNYPVRIQNEFFEMLEFGVGLQSDNACLARQRAIQMFNRGVYPLFSDIVPSGKTVRVRLSDAADVSKRVLIQGEDDNGMTIYSLDGPVQVLGEFLSLVSPFVDTPQTISKVTGVQKDITLGPVSFYEVDAGGNERLVLTMQPGETTASYRRMLVNGVPCSCCDTGGSSCSTTSTAQITAMAKLELIPARVDTDYLLIQNIEALIAECQAIRFSEMDSESSKKLAAERHREAIRYLQGELVHREGKQWPAVNFAPFGHARLRHDLIGSMQ